MMCSGENIELTFKFVNSQLETLGFPTGTLEENCEKQALVFTINSLLALITQYKSNITLINTHNETVIHHSNEIKRCKLQVKSLESQLSGQQSQIGILKNKLSLAETEKQKLLSQISILKKECNRIASSSEIDRKIYQKSISDQKELIKNLNDKLFCRDPPKDTDSGPINFGVKGSPADKRDKIMNECVQTLDATIQNLLSEIAMIRCCFVKLYLDLTDLVNDLNSKNHFNAPLEQTNTPEYIFQLPHKEFLESISLNLTIVISFLQQHLLKV